MIPATATLVWSGAVVIAAPRFGQVAPDDGHGLVEVLRGAELHDRRARRDQGEMPRRRVVSVAGHVSLLPIGPPESDLTFGDHDPVLTLAPIVGRPTKNGAGSASCLKVSNATV